jgi:hypothetical protein
VLDASYALSRISRRVNANALTTSIPSSMKVDVVLLSSKLGSDQFNSPDSFVDLRSTAERRRLQCLMSMQKENAKTVPRMVTAKMAATISNAMTLLQMYLLRRR